MLVELLVAVLVGVNGTKGVSVAVEVAVLVTVDVGLLVAVKVEV